MVGNSLLSMHVKHFFLADNVSSTFLSSRRRQLAWQVLILPETQLLCWQD